MKWRDVSTWLNEVIIPQDELRDAIAQWKIGSSAKTPDGLKKAIRLHASAQRQQDDVPWTPPSWTAWLASKPNIKRTEEDDMPPRRDTRGRDDRRDDRDNRNRDRRDDRDRDDRPERTRPATAEEIANATAKALADVLKGTIAPPAAAATTTPTAQPATSTTSTTSEPPLFFAMVLDNGRPIYKVVNPADMTVREPTGEERKRLMMGDGTDMTGLVSRLQSAATTQSSQADPATSTHPGVVQGQASGQAQQTNGGTTTPPAATTPDQTNTWKCAEGHPVAESEDFCPECGSPRYWECDECDEDTNPADRKACKSCGTKRPDLRPKASPVKKAAAKKGHDDHGENPLSKLGWGVLEGATLGIVKKPGGDHGKAH